MTVNENMKKSKMNKNQDSALTQSESPGPISKLRKNTAFNVVSLALLGLGIGVISLLLGATVFGVPMFRAYFTSPAVLILNLLPPILLIFLIYFISGRPWIAFTFPALFIVLISMIQFFKVQIRGDPLVVSDVSLISEVGKIMEAYTLTMNWKVYLALAALVCGILFSVFMLRRKPAKAPVRIIASIAVIAVSAALYAFVYTDTGLYEKTSADNVTAEWTPNRNYISKGFIYPLVYGIKGTIAEMKGNYPDWYNEADAKAALESYPRADIPADKKVNVISITLEAFSDLSRFDSIDFTTDVYGVLHALQAESVSGSLITNVFAGATIDTERLFLTGYTALTAYHTPTNSYVQYLRSQGYHTEGLHAGSMWFYDRQPVNKNLGFDNYYFLDDYADGSHADAFFFPKLLELYDSRDRSKPYFSYNLSYQNHGAYDSTKTAPPYVIAQDGMSDESYNILNNYLSGIYDTNQHIGSLIDSLRGESDPVVVVIFGDHMPWLGNMNSVYTELGINIDRGTEEGFYNYYTTPYIIWANDAAKKTLGNSFSGDGGSISPCFLMGEMFSLCSWDGDRYMQALRELRGTIDIINVPTGLFRENGVLTPDLSAPGELAYQKLRMIELYRRNNFEY